MAKKKKEEWKGLTVNVYLDDGRVFYYKVWNHSKAREHTSAIIATGYRHNNGEGIFEHYPPHRIVKVKVEGVVPTLYPDQVRGT